MPISKTQPYAVLIRKPLVWLIIIINLVVGNSILAALDASAFLQVPGIIGFSAPAVLLLLWGLRRVRAQQQWWKAALLGILSSVLILIVGSYCFGVGNALSMGTGLTEALGRALVMMMFGAVFGGLFTVPLALLNLVLFLVHQNVLRRDDCACQGALTTLPNPHKDRMPTNVEHQEVTPPPDPEKKI